MRDKTFLIAGHSDFIKYILNKLDEIIQSYGIFSCRTGKYLCLAKIWNDLVICIPKKKISMEP